MGSGREDRRRGWHDRRGDFCDVSPPLWPTNRYVLLWVVSMRVTVRDIRIIADKVPAWPRAFGVLALVAAIATLLVPFIGVVFITIPAAILGNIAFI
jgi:hypothetical protein